MFVLGDPVLHVLPADERERRPESKRSLQRDGSQDGGGRGRGGEREIRGATSPGTLITRSERRKNTRGRWSDGLRQCCFLTP